MISAGLEELIEKYQNDEACSIAKIYAYGGETDKAFEWLEGAYRQHDTGLYEIKISRLFPSLHSDPRWKAFLQKMKLPLD